MIRTLNIMPSLMLSVQIWKIDEKYRLYVSFLE